MTASTPRKFTGIGAGLVFASAISCVATCSTQAFANSHAKPFPATIIQHPLYFEPNVGQGPTQSAYISHARGYNLYVGATSATIQSTNRTKSLTGRAVTMTLVGAEKAATATSIGETPARVNYLIGNSPSKWRTHIATYARAGFHNTYPGVDTVYYGHDRELEYDFVVHPGASATPIAFRFDGPGGVNFGRNGALDVQMGSGTVTFHRPIAYQIMDGHRVTVNTTYVRHSNGTFGFAVGTYDHSRTLTIDPALVYATYLGGAGNDTGTGVAIDASHNAYVTGFTTSANLSSTSALHDPSGDAYVSKYTKAGALVYTTYIGGSSTDAGTAIAVDPVNSTPYIVGTTVSSDFPIIGGYQTTRANSSSTLTDGFLIKLAADGTTIDYSTYLGGVGNNVPTCVAVDGNGLAYVGGNTTSTTFPVHNGVPGQTVGTYSSGFVSKINTTLTSTASLVNSTYITSVASVTDVYGIAIDSASNVYVGGDSFGGFSTNSGSYQPANAGSRDGLAAKIKSDFTAFTWATYLGGSGNDSVYAVAVGTAGDVYLTGSTLSANFPISNGIKPQSTTAANAFFFHLSADGTTNLGSTAIGGPDVVDSTTNPPTTYTGGAIGYGIAVDANGNAIIVGSAQDNLYQNGFTAVPTQNYYGGSGDAFFAQISPNASQVLFITYFGGSRYDTANAVAVNTTTAVVAGTTQSTDLPVIGRPLAQAAYGGGTNDAFVARFGIPGNQPQVYYYSPEPIYVGSHNLLLSVYGDNFVSGASVSFNGGAPQPSQVTSSFGASSLTVTVPDSVLATVGTVNMIVGNPVDDGGLTSYPLTVVANSAPAVTSLSYLGVSPAHVYAGNGNSLITVNGSGFNYTTTVTVTYGTTTVNVVPNAGLGPNAFTITVPGAAVAQAGTDVVTVTNPGGGGANGGGTATANLYVDRVPVPIITSASPDPIITDSTNVALTITGTGFLPGRSVVTINGAAVTPVSVQATQIVLAISNTQAATIGNLVISITNPSPDALPTPDGGTASITVPVANNPAPAIVSLSPNPVNAGGLGTVLTINGTGFNANTTVSFDNGTPIVPTLVSSTQLTVVIPDPVISAVHTVNVTVTNPAPGGGSGQATLNLQYVQPVITTINPTSVPQGSTNSTVTLTGTNFTQLSTVTFNGVAASSVGFLGGGQLQVIVPVAALLSTGNINVVVSNPAPSLPSAPVKLYVTGVGLSSLTVAPSAVPGGAIVTGTVTINAAAPVGGTAVVISTDNGLANVPYSVTIPQGQTTASFTIHTDVVQAISTVQIKGTLAGVVVEAPITLSPFAGSSFGGGLRFFSEPFDFSSVSPDTLFGYTGVSLAVWNPAAGSYAVTPAAPADHVRLGRGYWARFPHSVSVTQTGPAADPTVDFSTQLQSGWNQIGDPFQQPVNVSDLKFNNSTLTFAQATNTSFNLIDSNLFGYDAPADGSKGQYITVQAGQALVTGQGYWIHANSDTSITFPHPTASTGATVVSAHSGTIRKKK